MTPQTLTTETCTQKLFHNCPDSKTRTTEQRSPRGFQSPDPGAVSPPGRYSSGPLAPDGADPPGRVSTPPPLPPEGRLKHRGATAPHSHTAAAASAQKLLPRRRARPGARALPATKGGASLLAAAPLAPLLGVPVRGPAPGWAAALEELPSRLLGKRPDELTKFLLRFFKVWVELTLPGRGCLPPSRRRVRRQASLYFTPSHCAVTRPNTRPCPPAPPGDRAPARRGAGPPLSASAAPADAPSDRPRPAPGTKRGAGASLGDPAAATLTRQLVRLQPGLGVQPADDKVVGEATGRRAPSAAAAAAHGAGAGPGRAERGAPAPGRPAARRPPLPPPPPPPLPRLGPPPPALARSPRPPRLP